MNENSKYWLAINNIKNLGPVTIKKMWEHFGDIKTVWEADEKQISEIEGLSRQPVKAFLENRGSIDLDGQMIKLEEAKVKALTLEDADYPSMLKNIYDPPPVLFIKGEILRSDEKALAIVGTRRASRYGLDTAKKLAAELAAMGITIISGMASGIDTAAHWGALSSKGRTIAVFGCGVDVIFPQENRGLAREIEKSGALVSEYPLGEATSKSNFPRRNRIISGLSLGVIMVEGHYDSGAMITAKQALEQGREVFAVPGNVGLDQSKGPHWLIKQGAKLVETVDDVIEELTNQIRISKPCLPAGRSETNIKSEIPIIDLSPEERRVSSVINHEPKHIDAIAVELNMPVNQLSGLLMVMEIKKAIRQLPGKMFTLY